MNLFIGYVGFEDGDMKPIACGNDHSTVFSDTLAHIAEMGLLRGTNMGVQDKGKISEAEYERTKAAFDAAYEKARDKARAV